LGATIVDVSLGGLLLRSHEPLHVEDRVALSFELCRGGRDLHVRAKVLRVLARAVSSDHVWEVGRQFEEVSSEDRRRLARLVGDWSEGPPPYYVAPIGLLT
jgi:hypothetical protein